MKMVSRPSFPLFLCVLILTGLSGAKLQNSSIKPAATNPKQSLVVNNNCGLAKSESEMLAHIKATVDSMASNSSKGNVKYILSKSVKKSKKASYRLLLVSTSSMG